MPQLLRDAAAPQPPMALRAPSTLPAPHLDLRSPRSLSGWARAAGQADSEDLICSAAAAGRAAETDRDRQERARRGILERIHRVRSYVEFRLLLGMQSLQQPQRPCCVPDFPLQQQAELLAALGGRLMALPYPEQVLAIRDFLAQPPGPACDGLLAELRAAALLGTEGLRRRERSLFDEGGMAHAAVSSGEHLRCVMRRFGLSSPEALEALEAAAMPRAPLAIGAGASVHVVVDGLGIGSQARREQLERHATGHVGMAAVGLGERPQSVAERLGIRMESCVRALRYQAARRLVLEGRSVQEAAGAQGIDHAGSMLGLELLATEVASVAIQEQGRHVHPSLPQPRAMRDVARTRTLTGTRTREDASPRPTHSQRPLR